MNPTQLDQIRDAMRRETEQLHPVGLEVEDVKRRGNRRRNRVARWSRVAIVTSLTAVGVAVAQPDGGKDIVDVAAQPEKPTPPPELEFRVVDGTIGYAPHFTSSDGVTYALSTAPGTPANPAQPGQAIYSTKDGATWTTIDQGQPWISDLAEGNGVLYAIGTAPGDNEDVAYRVGTSADGGKRWSINDIPFTETTPSATVSLSRAESVQLARNASTTIALLTEQFYPNLDAMVAERAPGVETPSTEQTSDGYNIIDLGGCMLAKRAGEAGAVTVDPEGSPEAICKDPEVIAAISWSDLGLQSEADLTRQQVLVSNDGKSWEPGNAPGTGFVTDLVGSPDGFLLLAQTGRYFLDSIPSTETTLMRSTDGRTWTTVATPADLSVQAISGNRVIATDGAGRVQTSSDSGNNWTATNIGAQLPAGTPPTTAMSTDAGPLGFAAMVIADDNKRDASIGKTYLLFSADGVTWSATDLATAGQPADSYPAQVTVGADHLGVDFQSRGADPGGPMKTTTLLATPKR